MTEEEQNTEKDYNTSRIISETASLSERLKAFAADLDAHTEMLKEFERRGYQWKS